MTRRPTLLLAAALVTAGCGHKPSAPALVTEAVYQNAAAGVSFAAPEGWVLAAKGSVPPGPLTHPTRLVSYTAPDAPAGLELYALDVPAGQDLPAYLDANKIGGEAWVTKGAGAADTVGGAAVTRYTQTTGKKGDRTRELTAFARSGRTLAFVLVYPTGESGPRDTGRRAVDSTTWK